MGAQCHAPTALPPGKSSYPLYMRLGGPQGRSGRVRKISPTGIRSPERPARSESLYRLSYRSPQSGRVSLRLKRDGTWTESRFRLSAKRTSPFKSAGASVQSTTAIRRVRISGSNAGYTMFRSSVKSTGYPLHSPVSPSLPPARHRVLSHFNLTPPVIIALLRRMLSRTHHIAFSVSLCFSLSHASSGRVKQGRFCIPSLIKCNNFRDKCFASLHTP
jgi:hypothetical protein